MTIEARLRNLERFCLHLIMEKHGYNEEHLRLSGSEAERNFVFAALNNLSKDELAHALRLGGKEPPSA